MNIRKHLIAGIMVAVVGSRIAVSQEASTSTAARELNIAAQGYLVHQDSLSGFLCEFDVEIGDCPSHDSALSKGPQDNITQAKGRWVKNGDEEVFEIDREISKDILPAAGIGGPAGLPSVGISLPPQKIAKNKDFCLHVSGMLGGGSILEGDSDRFSPDISPLNLAGMMGHGAKLNPANIVIRLSEQEETRNAVTIGVGEFPKNSIRIDAKVPDGMNYICEVDPSRSFICTYMSMGTTGELPTRKAYVIDAKEIRPGVWFPIRVVLLVRSTDTWEGPVNCTEIVVTTVRADPIPSQADMRLTLEKGTRLHNGVDPNSSITLAEDRVVAASELSSLAALTTNAALTAERSADISDQPSGQTPTRRLVLYFNFALILVLVVVVWRKYR